MSKVEVYQTVENGIVKLGVQINDPAASVEDLLEAWQPLCDDEQIYKTYGADNHSACRGCTTNCCSTAYVIPDLISFKRMAVWLGQNERSFAEGWFQPDKRELGLLRMKPDPCIFLQERVCSIYPVRSLICRFYLCTPLLGDTEQLIYSIAWSGAAATQAYARQQGYLPAQPGSGSTSFDRLFMEMLKEYSGHPGIELFMAANDYKDIPLSVFQEHGD